MRPVVQDFKRKIAKKNFKSLGMLAYKSSRAIITNCHVHEPYFNTHYSVRLVSYHTLEDFPWQMHMEVTASKSPKQAY